MRRTDAGSGTLEVVLTVPVLLTLLLLIVQFGLYWHATHVAQAAAQEGVRTARMVDGTAATGQDRARAFLAHAAPSLLKDVSVTANRDARHATVHVHATVEAVIPGMTLTVDVDADGPSERFRPDPT